VPQFVVAGRPALPQFVILEATFLALAAANAALWALLAGELRLRLHRPGLLRLVSRIGGSLLIAAGVLTAAARR
jgi:threonine/homoserine/homoserine lactone efflux protein